MKTITKKIITSLVTAAISLTAAATLAAPATPVLAATDNSAYSYSYEQVQFERKKEEGIRFLQNCVSDPSYAAISLTNKYITAVIKHPYDPSKTLEQNNNDIVRYVNNVYKNIQYVDESCKIEAYKASKIAYLYSLVGNEPTDAQREVLDYVAYCLSFIKYPDFDTFTREERARNRNISAYDQKISEVDLIIGIAENALL